MELQQLQDVAKYLEYKHHHAMGAEKLEKELTAHCEEVGTSIEEIIRVISSTNNVDKDVIDKLSNISFKDSEQKADVTSRAKKQKEAMRLIRCIITTNNKNKTSYSGEIFCARNKILPEVKKMILFGKPTHIPQILLNVIKEKEYQTFREVKLSDGRKIKETNLVKEYNIQELPPISKEELEAIAKKQLAEGYNGS